MQTQHIAEIEEVRWVIRECLRALRGWDRETLHQIFDEDSAAIHFGTAQDEMYVGGATYLQAIERLHTETIPDIEFDFLPGSPIIQTRDTVAWAVGQARVSGTTPTGHYFEIPTRLSFVLEKNASGWQIVHSHYSIGVSTP